MAHGHIEEFKREAVRIALDRSAPFLTDAAPSSNGSNAQESDLCSSAYVLESDQKVRSKPASINDRPPGLLQRG